MILDMVTLENCLFQILLIIIFIKQKLNMYFNEKICSLRFKGFIYPTVCPTRQGNDIRVSVNSCNSKSRFRFVGHKYGYINECHYLTF